MGIYQGTSGNDSVVGGGSNDTLQGLAGNDTLNGGAGADLLDGGDGNDVFSANDDSGADTMLGGNGNDTFNLSYNYPHNFPGSTVVKIDAGAGDDTINVSFAQWAMGALPEVTGGAGVDTYAFGFSASFQALTVTDFTVGVGGDRIDLRELYHETVSDYNRYHGGNPFATGQLKLVQVGDDTQVQGLGYYDTYVQTILVLKNVTASSLTSANFAGGWSPDGSAVTGKVVTSDKTTGAVLVGEAFNDTITGNSYGNSMYGFGGDDLLTGGSGNELLMGGYGDDTLYGGAGNDTLNGEAGNNLLDGGDGSDVFFTSSGSGGGKDTLLGGAGNDVFEYGVRALEATATGGDGQDTYRPTYPGYYSRSLPTNLNVTDFTAGAGGDKIDLTGLLSNTTTYAGGNPFSAANGYVRVVQDGADTRLQMDMDGAAGANYSYTTILTLKNFTASTLTADNFVNGLKPDGSSVIGVVASISGGKLLAGTSFDDQLTATGGANTLIGYGGDDTLVAGSGAANGLGDQLEGRDGNDTLIGGDANDKLYGGAGDDLLQGGAGNDTLIAYGDLAPGNDTLQGGDGDDLFIVGRVAAGARVLATGGAGRDVFLSSGNSYHWNPGLHDEFVVSDFAAGAGGDLIDLSEILQRTNYAGGNPFSAGNAYVRLVQLGADTLVQISPATDGNNGYVTVLTLQNIDKGTLTADNFVNGLKPDGTHIAGLNLSTGDTVHQLQGAQFDDTLTGTGGGNQLYGNGGDDRLQAGVDANNLGDQLLGGHGNDTLLGGDGNDSLDGETGTNLLQGGAGDDTLASGYYSIDDTLEGGAGNDRFDIYQSSSGHVATALGGDGNDRFYTYVYQEGLGAVLSGGAGRDTYVIRNDDANTLTTGYVEITDFRAGDGGDILDITQLMNYAAPYGYTGGNPLSESLGYLRLLQSGADVLLQFNMIGNQNYLSTVAVLRNVNLADLTAQNMVGANPKGDTVPGVLIDGTADGDHLGGGYFNDTLHGNGGSDSMEGGAGDDLLVAGDVEDVVYGSVMGGDAGNDTLIGGNGADHLTGSGGNNVLTGGGGNDEIQIDGGNDSADGGDGDDIISVRGSGNDTVTGGAGNDALSILGYYATINLRFDGGAGNDRVEIHGDDLGASKITLTGGAGIDTYAFDGPAFSSNVHVTDFATGAGSDRLDLNEILLHYAGYNKLLLDPMAAGYVKLVQQGPNVVVQFDTDGSGSGATARTILILDNVKLADITSSNFVGRYVSLSWGDGYGTYGNDVLEGNYSDNRFEAGGGDDTLISGGGADTLVGGAGNDVYVLGDNASATLVEAANGGVDTVQTSRPSYTLAANLEALQYTGDSDFYGVGNASGNMLSGGAGNDTLDGNGGGDILTGLGGDDVYVLRSATDRVVEAADGGYDLVQVSYTNAAYTLAANVEYATLMTAAAAGSLAGNDLNNYLTGNGAANSLSGGAGNDTLDGGAAADKLAGGKGDDLYVVDNAGDTITELANEGTDTVETTAAKYTLAANVEHLRYTGSAAFAGSGNELANHISGGIGNDTLLGGAGNDTLTGGGGTDAIDGGDGDDTVVLSDSIDHYTISRANGVVTLENSILNERVNLKGIETVVFKDSTHTIAELLLNKISDGDDYLGGTDGDDSLDGLAGADSMTGGSGDDRYVIDNVKDTIRELADEGNDSAELVFKAAATYTLGANVENAEVKAAAGVAVNVNGNELDNTITGNAAANTLSGGAGNDTLDGGAGADKLIGGTGNDSYRVDSTGDLITEGVNEGIDTVRTTLSTYTLPANVENLSGPGNGVLNGTGNALDNRIDGGLGADTLSGLAGNDTLTGAVGNDSLLGGDGDDRLEGGVGANLLDGGAGVDTAVALADFSAYTVKRPNATDTVLTHASSGEVLTLRNVEFVSFNGTLMAIQDVQLNVPSVGNDYMRGGSGDDLMSGGAAGADTMAGGDGNDTYQIDDVGDTIVETINGGDQDQAQVALTKAGTYTLGAYVENATVTSAASVAVNLTGNDSNNQLTGNAAANTLSGGAGNDTLDGGAGADKLIGGTGNDLYKIDNSGDTITELAAQGSDSVDTTLAKYTLGANVENLLYKGALAFAGTGNELANSIEGSSGNDTLSGLAGDDVLKGGEGNDSLQGGDGADQLDAGTGIDTVDGGTGSDTLTLLGNFADYGRSRPNAGDIVLTNKTTHESITVRNVEKFVFADGLKELADLAYNTPSINNDSLFGGDGNDDLNGLAGADQMFGGLGDDTYTVDQAGDKVFESADSGDDVVLVAFAKAETFVMGDNVERATITAAAGIAANVTGNALDNWLIGNAAANTLTGGAGNDTLDGGAGADKLSGGLDNDLYLVDNAGDVVTELADQGVDRVVTTLAKYTLTANVEELLFKGSVAFSGTGNELGNSINGGGGNDTLSGLGGDDILSGGAGNDSLLGGNGDDQLYAGTGVDVADGGLGIDTLTLLGNFNDYSRSRPNTTDLVLVNTITHESITVRNVEQFIFADDSKSMSDVVVNSASPLNDSLTGTDGNDNIDGGAGIDTMAGGLGDDIYTVDQSGDVVQEGADAGTDQVNVAYAKAGTYTLGDNIENASVTAAASVAVNLTGNDLDNALTGNAAANTLIGGAGKDTLDGGAGADKMDGGSGGDSYVVDNAGDTITELAGGGRDLVTVKGISSYSLASEVEELVFSGATAFTGNGNVLANRLTGGSGADVLNGLAGNDTLTGNAGNDKLLGGDGDDQLIGGDGADTLTGGTGADTFVLASKLGVDAVTDFASGTDKLGISQSVFGIGSDLVIDNAVVKAGPGGFDANAELVILTQNVASLTLNTAAAAIGSANSAYAVGDKALFALHSGTTTMVYLFTSNGADATVSAGELTQLATLTGTASTTAADYLFV